MAERLTIISEGVDDIPRVLAQLDGMGVPLLLDEPFPEFAVARYTDK
jgi:hypothetical protein